MIDKDFIKESKLGKADILLLANLQITVLYLIEQSGKSSREVEKMYDEITKANAKSLGRIYKELHSEELAKDREIEKEKTKYISKRSLPLIDRILVTFKKQEYESFGGIVYKGCRYKNYFVITKTFGKRK